MSDLPKDIIEVIDFILHMGHPYVSLEQKAKWSLNIGRLPPPGLVGPHLGVGRLLALVPGDVTVRLGLGPALLGDINILILSILADNIINPD